MKLSMLFPLLLVLVSVALAFGSKFYWPFVMEF